MGNSPVGVCNWEPLLLYGKPYKRKGVDVIRAPIVVEKNLNHPCPKPIEWGRKLVQLLTNENDIVFDPFMGSGTVAIASKYQNRNFIGIEISPEYCKIAEQRLAQEVLAL